MSYIQDSQEIGLTIAGVKATAPAAPELDMFLRLVRAAVSLERDFEPIAGSNDAPTLTATSAAVLLGLDSSTSSQTLCRLGAILESERWGWVSASNHASDNWSFGIGSEVRRYRNVTDIDSYWQLRPKHWVSDVPALDVPVELPEPEAKLRSSMSVGEIVSIAVAVAVPLGATPLGWATVRLLLVLMAALSGVVAWRQSVIQSTDVDVASLIDL